MENTAPHEKISFQIQFWSLLGPFLALLGLFLVFLRPTPMQWLFPLLATFGLFLCWRWKLRGLFFALALLVLFCAYGYKQIPREERFWYIALCMTFASTFISSSLCFEEANERVENLQIQIKSHLEKIYELDEKFKESEDQICHRVPDLEKELSLALLEVKRERENSQDRQKKFEEEKALLSESLQDFENRVVSLTEDKKLLESSALQSKEELSSLKEQLEAKQTKAYNLTQAECLYLQLREQFEEKSRILDDTRRELFYAEEKNLIQQKEVDEFSRFGIPENEQALQKLLLATEEELRERERECRQLSQIISCLSSCC